MKTTHLEPEGTPMICTNCGESLLGPKSHLEPTNSVKFDEAGIRIDCDGNAQLQILIERGNETYSYGFNVDCVPIAARQWLFEVVDRQMQEIHKKGVAHGVKNVRALMKEALGT